MPRLCSRLLSRRSQDEGQVLLLVLVYAVIAGMLVTVVVNLSRAFLDRRSLVAAADAAALAAANEPDLARVYAGGPAAALPLSDDGARAAVRRYVRDAALHERFAGFRVVEVVTDGHVVHVTLAARTDFPFVNVLSARLASGYWFDATAHATSRFGR